MLILATDTSSKHGGIALARGDRERFEVLEVVPLVGGTFSAQLIPQVAALLDRHQVRKQDLDGFAAATGPGSFTGLRVGLAGVKALAEVLGKPIAPVSVLEAIAAVSGLEGRVLAVLDAGRNEVFAGEYAVKGSLVHRLGESLLSRDDFLAHACAAVHRTRVATPDASLGEFLRAHGLECVVLDRPRADAIARLGLRKLLAGQTVSVEQLDANYLRRSDAEIFSLPKLAGSTTKSEN
ncbi:MAG TPA: tRNA (adenosine(37)-N6)-threonylcarbamoyltransferase complex dimerization subunit type 1 TsaB [Terriglobales bacterium]|nr:tRNA (adenosine(37)-N6)-threonylcarbamoyltransferase complex dimerization subunit type 1 TsaB [Terriglobales bacterium]